MYFKQLIDLEKKRTQILKCKTDLQDLFMYDRSVTQQMIIYKGRLLKKSSNKKLKPVLSTLVTNLKMAFKQCIAFATDLAANFGCNQCRMMPDVISKLLHVAIWSCCAVQFRSEQTHTLSSSRFLQHLDLVLCTGCYLEHTNLFLCHISNLDQSMI